MKEINRESTSCYLLYTGHRMSFISLGTKTLNLYSCTMVRKFQNIWNAFKKNNLEASDNADLSLGIQVKISKCSEILVCSMVG